MTEASSQWKPRWTSDLLTNILDYTPHTPDICCLAANPSLRRARERVAGTRVQHAEHRRGDLYLCWDDAKRREYHLYQGTLENLINDVGYIAWWIARDTVERVEDEYRLHPFPLEVHIKRVVRPSGAATSVTQLLTLLSSPPLQTTSRTCACALVFAPKQAALDAACMSTLGRLRKLEKLESFANEVETLPPLPQLHVLNLRNANNWDSLRWLGTVSSLRKLSLCRCHGLRDVSALSQLPLLEQLNIANSSELSLRGDFHECTRLKEVALSWCTAVTEAESLGTLPALEVLDLSYSTCTPIDGVLHCARLRSLSLRGCSNAVDLLSTLSTLHSSRTSAHSRTRRRPAVWRFLEDLNLGETTVTTLKGLQDCTSLRHVGLRECRALTSLYPLGTLPSVESIDASYSGIHSVDALSTCPNLRRLNVRACEGLTTLQPLLQVVSLEEVDASTTVQSHVLQLRLKGDAISPLNSSLGMSSSEAMEGSVHGGLAGIESDARAQLATPLRNQTDAVHTVSAIW